MTDQKLTIGFVLDDRLDKPDGVQQYISLLGSWLSSQGHEVHYLVGESPTMKDRKDVHHMGRTVEVKFNKNRMGVPLPVKSRDIKQLFSEIEFDILHVQMPYSPQVAARIINKAPKSTAIVGTFHILPYSFTERNGTRLLAGVLRSSRRKFDEVFSVSTSAKDFAQKYFKVDSDVLPNMVELSRFSKASAAKSSRKKIVFLGRLVERKGALELALAYEKLLALHPELAETTELIIGGKGQQMAELESVKARIKSAHPDSKIELAGFVPEQDKPDFLHQAFIAAFPATGGESFGITLLEGMAAGAGVVLAGNNPGYNSVLGNIPECIIEPRNTADFASKLYDFLTNEKLFNRVNLAQSEYVKQFDVNVVGSKILEHYQKLALAKQKQHN